VRVKPISTGSSSGTNRLFILIAVAIIGLICIGLIGMSLALFRLQNSLQQAEVVQAPTVPVIISTATPTPTDTPIPPTPTDTPLPTATATWVINPNAQQAANDQRPTEVVLTANPFGKPQGTQEPTTEPGQLPAAPTTEPGEQMGPTTEPGVTPTNTLVVQTPTAMALAQAAATPLAQIPQGGGVLPASDSFLSWAGLGVLLLLIWGLIGYLRSPSSISDR
jgi:hypothetical protein